MQQNRCQICSQFCIKLSFTHLAQATPSLSGNRVQPFCMPTCTVERHMAGYENTVQTRRKVCEQVEYYLSDENLQKDRFFRELIASDAAGWIDLTPIMQCNKIKETKITKDELAEAIQTSEVLQFNNGWVRRKIPFQAGNGNTKGEAKGGGKGKGKRGNANLPSVERASPIYDPSGPCGYFMAGYCQRGDSCSLQHSVPYAMAIRHEWLNPGNRDAKRDLQTLSMRLLGETATKELFPRVFSHKLQCKEMPTMPTDDISMLGFSWSTDEAPAPDKVSRWNRHPQKMTADIPARKLQGQQAQQAPKIRYFLVFDLEGKYEIIEFPVLLFDAVSGCEIGRFQKFVRPKDLFEGWLSHIRYSCSPISSCIGRIRQLASADGRERFARNGQRQQWDSRNGLCDLWGLGLQTCSDTMSDMENARSNSVFSLDQHQAKLF